MAIQAAPRNATLYLKRAELRRMHYEHAAAETDYGEAHRLDPALKEVHLGRGKLLIATGKLPEAKRDLDTYLELSPNHLDALLTRARMEVKRGYPLLAASDFSRALAVSQKPEPEYYVEYAQALSSAGPEHVTAAIEVLDSGMVSLGPIPTLALPAIDLLVSQKEFDAALNRLDALSGTGQRRETWLERRGDILLEAGRPEEALTAFKEALSAVSALPARVQQRKATSELKERLRTKTEFSRSGK